MNFIYENRNNKGRRNELTKLKYIKRLKQLGFKEGEGNFYSYKSHGNQVAEVYAETESIKEIPSKAEGF